MTQSDETFITATKAELENEIDRLQRELEIKDSHLIESARKLDMF